MLDTEKKTAKSGKKTRKKYLLLTLLLFLGIVFLNNTNIFFAKEGHPLWMAHRGVHQTFDEGQTSADSNTAMMITPTGHDYMENTIASMEAAFEGGASIVEFDIQLTKDEQFAVFHDTILEFRTEAVGEVRDFTMKELRELDIGYGYSYDNGETFPFRGKYIGQMPELEEVLARFPKESFLVHIKDGNLRSAEVLSAQISEWSPELSQRIFFYGNDEVMQYLLEHHPDYKVFSRKLMVEALLQYELLGWTGQVPKQLHNKVLLLPVDYAPFLWGFPEKFVQRMEKAGTVVILAKGDGSPAEGFDTKEEQKEIPKGFSGYVWTNKIEERMK